jgi:hypothetical protein
MSTTLSREYTDYIPGTRFTEWSTEYQAFLDYAQRKDDNNWDTVYSPIQEAADGSKVVAVGSEAAGYTWVTVEPAPEPEPEISADAFIESPRKVTGYLFHREEDHGKWYESGWMWFYLGVTALIAFIWNVPMNMPAEMNNGEWSGAGFAYFVWLFVGWMPLAASLIGALQKEGYRRLAAVYSVVLFALITWFFHSQMKDSVNNR